MEKVEYGAYRLKDRAISNEKSHQLISEIIDEDIPLFEKGLAISNEIVYLSDNTILTSTLALLVEEGFVNVTDKLTIRFRISLDKEDLDYAVRDCLIAMFTGVYLKYRLFTTKYKILLNDSIPELKWKIYNGRLYHNLDDILQQMLKNCIDANTIKKKEGKLESTQELLFEMARSDFENNSQTFAKDIQYLQVLKDKLMFENDASDTTDIDNDFEHKIFKDKITLERFEEYVSKHIIDPHLDYSYLYQRLLKENLIYFTRHKSFMDWLYENKLISEKVFNDFKIKNQFYSLSKCSPVSRENNFNNIFLKPPKG